MNPILYLDIETLVGHPSEEGLLLVGYALDDEKVSVLDWALVADRDAHQISDGTSWRRFAELLADPAVPIVEQTKYDARYLKLAGFEVAGPIHDTTVMAHMLNENTPLDIEWLAWRYAGITMDKRLRRTGGEVYFKSDNGREYNLNVMKEMWSTEPDVWLEFEEYCARDVDSLRTLYLALRQRLDESEWLPYFLEERVPYTNVLVDVETHGLPINVESTVSLAEELTPEKDRLAAELLREAGLPPSFNLNSQHQLVGYLFSRAATFKDALVYDVDTLDCLKSCAAGEHDDCDDDGETGHVIDCLPEGFVVEKLGRDRVHGHWTVMGRGLKATPPPVNKVTGEKGKLPSTSSPELLFMHAEDPWVRKLCLEYRKLEKLLTGFLTKWPSEAVDGRLYGRFNQTGTVTGRLSSSGPNLQNVPARGTLGKKVRSLFEAPEDRVLVVGDYDQLEMRLMAHFSEDVAMTRIFREGRDPHAELALAIFGAVEPSDIPAGANASYRDAAKTLNYAMGYGAGPKKVAQTLSLMGWPTTKEVATGYLAEMSRYFRGFFRYKQGVMDKAKRAGSVQTIGGGRRRLRAAFKDTANWKLIGYGERQAVNAVIQGSAADILRRVMVAMAQHDAFAELTMLAQVHDELVWEAWDSLVTPGLLEDLQLAGETWHGFDLRVPLVFEPHAGPTWAAAKNGDLDIIELLEEETWDE